LLLTFSLFCYVAFSQCSYSSGNYKMSLSSISGQTLTWSDSSFRYSWTPCANSLTCGTSGTAMATQVNIANSNCNKLAGWDASVPASYDATTSMWTIEFNNGATCNNAPRNLQLYLSCKDGGATTFTQVVNPSGTCEYDYYLSGSIFCPTGGGGGGGGGGSGSSDSDELSGGWVFIIILLVVTFVYCTAGFVYNKTKNNKDGSWADRSNIPNVNFWTSLPKWTWAGCCVTKEWISSKMGNKNETHEPLPNNGN